MIELFHEIKDTPIPTLLVVGGLLFLILAVAGKIAGRIEVPPTHQKVAGVIGAVLLALGIALHLTPPSLLALTPPPSTAITPIPAAPVDLTLAPSSALPLIAPPPPATPLPPTLAPPTPALSVLPQHSTVGPTATPLLAEPMRSPEASVRAYWQAVSAGQYEIAWGMLSANFRWTTHHNDFADYKQRYLDMALCDVAPNALETIMSAEDYALVYARVVYHKDSACAVSSLDLAFHLAPDPVRGLWLIDRVDLR